jgi:peptidoglycan/LPS O-acetylase OafA/YrhL
MSRISALTADVVAISVFALFARIAHQTDDMPLNFAGWLSTLWPFLLGVALSWIVIVAAKWDGARLVPAGVSAWIITVVAGLGIWAARNGEFPHWSFMLVATIMSALLMLGWRAIAGSVGRRRRA